jgi:hypothetical protein
MGFEYPLRREDAAEWIGTLRRIYAEGYLSWEKFEAMKRSIEARVERPWPRS